MTYLDIYPFSLFFSSSIFLAAAVVTGHIYLCTYTTSILNGFFFFFFWKSFKQPFTREPHPIDADGPSRSPVAHLSRLLFILNWKPAALLLPSVSISATATTLRFSDGSSANRFLFIYFHDGILLDVEEWEKTRAVVVSCLLSRSIGQENFPKRRRRMNRYPSAMKGPRRRVVNCCPVHLF